MLEEVHSGNRARGAVSSQWLFSLIGLLMCFPSLKLKNASGVFQRLNLVEVLGNLLLDLLNLSRFILLLLRTRENLLELFDLPSKNLDTFLCLFVHSQVTFSETIECLHPKSKNSTTTAPVIRSTVPPRFFHSSGWAAFRRFQLEVTSHPRQACWPHFPDAQGAPP